MSFQPNDFLKAFLATSPPTNDEAPVSVSKKGTDAKKPKKIKESARKCTEDRSVVTARISKLFSIDGGENITALLHAAATGSVDRIQTLISAGVYVNTRNEHGLTALLVAAVCGHHDVVSLLKTANASCEDLHTDVKLLVDRFSSDSDAVELLSDLSKKLNVKGADRLTALEWAASTGNVAATVLLLLAGASLGQHYQQNLTPLMLAVQKGKLNTIKVLIDAGADLDAQTWYGYTALMYAAQDNNLEVTRALIAAGADVNAVKTSYTVKTTPLTLAVEKGYADIVQALVDAGAEIHGKTSPETALLNVVTQGLEEMLKIFLRANIDVDAVNLRGETLLMLAASKGHAGVAKLLLDARATTEVCDSQGKTAIFYACEEASPSYTDKMNMLIGGANRGVPSREQFDMIFASKKKDTTEVLKVLLAAGASCLVESNGDTPLMWAIKNLKMNAAKVLVDAGARLDSATAGNVGDKAIKEAILYGNVANLQTLVSSKVDVNKEDENGQSPLVQASEARKSSLVEVLLNANADINAFDRHHGTFGIIRAAQLGDVGLLKALVAAGRDVNVQKPTGEIPLISAARVGKTEAVQFLLDSGAKVDAQDSQGMTALALAAAWGHTNTVRVLERANANKEAKDINGNTPLMQATFGNRVATVEALRDAGARTDVVNENGQTAVAISASRGFNDLSRYLLRGAVEDSKRQKLE